MQNVQDKQLPTFDVLFHGVFSFYGNSVDLYQNCFNCY